MYVIIMGVTHTVLYTQPSLDFGRDVTSAVLTVLYESINYADHFRVASGRMPAQPSSFKELIMRRNGRRGDGLTRQHKMLEAVSQPQLIELDK